MPFKQGPNCTSRPQGNTKNANIYFYLTCLVIFWLISVGSCCIFQFKTPLQLHYSVPTIEKNKRVVGAWLPVTEENYEKINEQLVNTSSWGGLLDVVQLQGCGWNITDDVMEINETVWQGHACQTILKTLNGKGIDIHMWVGGVSNSIVASPRKFTDSVVNLLKKQTFVKGIHFDDETECAPRATMQNFTSWLNFMNSFSEDMHQENIQVSAAVQALFGIENVPYVHNYPCLQPPWKYKTNKTLVNLIQQMKVDRFLEMDTYYFTLARYLNVLDWYIDNVPLDKLGVAVANRAVNPLANEDEYLARVYALEKSRATWWNFFDLPIDKNWLEWAWRWKTRCAGCPNMSCYELDVSCTRFP